MADVDLNFLAAKIERLTQDVAMLKDDLAVNTAIVMRVDGTLQGLLSELAPGSHARRDTFPRQRTSVHINER
jgi:hypothetical protein